MPRRTGQPPSRRRGEDWERRITRKLERDGVIGERDYVATAVRRSIFTRRIYGFGRQALDLMRGYKLENFDEDKGFVTVTFSGTSQKLGKKMEYRRPSVIAAKGIVVMTGMVDGSNIDEIGHGPSNIIQAEAPVLDGFDTPKRLNVSLGHEPDDFETASLNRALAVSQLVLSGVATINGQPRLSWHELHYLEGLNGRV